jgi:hypothetical protein
MSFEIDYPHSLGQAAARERIGALGDYLANKHGLTVSWLDGDRATIRGKYLVVSIEGTVTVEADRVRFEGKDPGMLWVPVPRTAFFRSDRVAWSDRRGDVCPAPASARIPGPAAVSRRI